jgi:hypothetical protein
VALYDKDTGELDVPPGYAVHLTKIGFKWDKGDPLFAMVPERGTHMFALHPENWKGTFYSLTNKDLHKIANYGPKVVKIAPGTLVAEMAYANNYMRTGNVEWAKRYADSVRPIEDVDLSSYKLPELLIPRKP